MLWACLQEISNFTKSQVDIEGQISGEVKTPATLEVQVGNIFINRPMPRFYLNRLQQVILPLHNYMQL